MYHQIWNIQFNNNSVILTNDSEFVNSTMINVKHPRIQTHYLSNCNWKNMINENVTFVHPIKSLIAIQGHNSEHFKIYK